MNNEETKELIESFRAYRDLLTPVQKNLSDFVQTYDVMKENIDKLNIAFEGDVKGKIENLFENMAEQAGKTASLSGKIDELASATDKFAYETAKLGEAFERIETLAASVEKIEGDAQKQIAKLDKMVEEKSRSYDLNSLERSLESYNDGIKKVGEFINKDIAGALSGSNKQLDAMRGGLDAVVKAQTVSESSLEKLIGEHKAASEFLKTIVQKQDVNEAYLFDILDRWAQSRKLKIR